MTTAICWFRRDLRIADNPALAAARSQCDRVIALFIYHPAEEDPWPPGAASRWWLHHSLSSLQDNLARLGNRLIIRQGSSATVLRELLAQTDATHLFWNRLYDPATIERDRAIKQWVSETDVDAQSFNACLLNEPWAIQNGKGDPYRVFTPYWKTARQRPLADVRPAPERLPPAPGDLETCALDTLGLLPKIRWDRGLADTWTPGEDGAQLALQRFLRETADDYGTSRDIPGQTGTSRLSPHLHFGEISPPQIVARCRAQAGSDGVEAFVRELYWREFGYHMLYHFPQTPSQALDPRFREFPWMANAADELQRWQAGKTGIPVVDAGMRELWHTGWIHNRVRMIVASLLTKNLLLPWQEGARWFWDTLVDADLASNTLGWQWTAGCGADAAPYFRIFNPVTQGERFDGEGKYVRRWVPELDRLPDKWLHKPWEAPEPVLRDAGVRLGDNYPLPVVDLKSSRARALDIWDQIKTRGRS